MGVLSVYKADRTGIAPPVTISYRIVVIFFLNIKKMTTMR